MISDSEMMTIECTTDVGQIRSAIEADYDQVIYDGCPSFEDFVPDTEHALWFLLKKNNIVAGLIKLESLNYVTWMPHIVIGKEHRGKGSEQWGIQVAQFMKQRIPDATFLVLTPYESAKNYAERVGFKLIGMLPKSMRKNGKVMDQYVLGGDLFSEGVKAW